MMRRMFLLTALAVLLSWGAAPAADPKVGDKVWAQWKPNDWFHGKIDKVGTVGLHVAFDDGDQADLPPALLAVDEEPKAGTVKVGARVLALWTDGKYYPGHVVKRGGGQFDIKFDDGAARTVGRKDLRLMAVKPGPRRTAKLGDKVWAQWKPNDWYHGTIDKVSPVGLHVAFDDGDQADLPTTMIALDRAPARGAVKVGKRVLGLWTDKRFYPATVTSVAGGQYGLKFDDSATRTVGLDDLRPLNE